MSPDPLVYYAQPGPFTTLSNAAVNADLLAGLPSDIPALVACVQHNLLHIFWAERYGVTLSEEQANGVQVRTAAERLRRIHAADPAPLTVARPPDRRSVGNCRDFSLLTVALLRRQGIPARARCGFGTYFLPDHYEDHWVAEYWNGGRWVQVDAQLDRFQQEALKIDFDPFDVPRDRFVSGGRAWQLCREEGVDPDKFGIFGLHGLWFVAGDLLRDLAALNKMELLPWDCWGVLLEEGYTESDDALALLDRAAAMTLADNAQFDTLQAFYTGSDRLRVPPVIASFPGGPTPVSIFLTAEPGIAMDIRTKPDLLVSIDTARRVLETALDGLGEAEMTRPGVCGGWSIQDILAHITGWEQHLLRWYRAGQAGAAIEWPVPGFFTDDEVERINRAMYDQNCRRPLAAVRADFESSYQAVRAAVQAMSEDDIFGAGRYAWTRDETLLAYIRANTDDHYLEHAAQIRAWRAG